MSNTWNKMKTKAVVSSMLLFSLFGGKVEAKTPEHNNAMKVTQSVVVNNSDRMASYSNSINASLNNRMFMLSSDVCLYDIGNGYKVFRESYASNNKQEMSSCMISPDGRKIDISFCNTSDFMLPSYLESNGLTEVKNDPAIVKENNDKWKHNQHNLAMKKIRNSEDREAFMIYVGQIRDGLENGTFPEALMQAHISKGVVKDYSYQASDSTKDVKELRKHYKDIKRQSTKHQKEIIKGLKKGKLTYSTITSLYTNTNS